MPRAVMIDPIEMRSKRVLELAPIPLNQYDRSVTDELASGTFTKDDLVRIQRDMMLIRAFEEMLDSVKKLGHYKDIPYNHRGPGPSFDRPGSVGRRPGVSARCGRPYLRVAPLSWRNPGQEPVGDPQAQRPVVDVHHGQLFRRRHAARRREGDVAGSTHDLAIDFIVYGALAEIFARDTGINRGFGGSMHAFFPPFGVYPNNAIVGGSADIAVGAALYKHVNKKPGIAIANIGDASAGCGPTWEALCFATMDQFKELWDAGHRGGLPLIMNFVNNFYGMGGQPVGETMGFKVLARLGAGLRPEQMHAERVDGYNPLAVIDAIRRKRKSSSAATGRCCSTP